LPLDEKKSQIIKITNDVLSDDSSVILKYFAGMREIISLDNIISMKRQFNLNFVSLYRRNLLESAISAFLMYKTGVTNIFTDSNNIDYQSIIWNNSDSDEMYLRIRGIILALIMIRDLKSKELIDTELIYENDVENSNTFLEKMHGTRCNENFSMPTLEFLPIKLNNAAAKHVVLKNNPIIEDTLLKLTKLYSVNVDSDYNLIDIS
jgi:hypothetical protein